MAAVTLPSVNNGDWDQVRRNFARIKSILLGSAAIPTFAGLTLTGLTASRLVWTDADKELASKDLVDLVAGTANEIDVADDGSGGITIGIVDPLTVAKGGSGAATFTDHSILLGSGTGPFTALGAAVNGQLPIGSTGADPVLATLTGTANEIEITNGAGSITIGIPDAVTLVNPTVTGILDASAGKVLVEDGATSEPSGESDGYVGVAYVSSEGRLYFVVEGTTYYVTGTSVTPPTPGVGNPIGLLLSLTYAS